MEQSVQKEQQQQELNTKFNFKKYFQKFSLIGKTGLFFLRTVYHYVDMVTDIMLLISVYNIDAPPHIKQEFRNAAILVLCFMIFERYISYEFVKGVIMKINEEKEKEQQKKEKIHETEINSKVKIIQVSDQQIQNQETVNDKNQTQKGEGEIRPSSISTSQRKKKKKKSKVQEIQILFYYYIARVRELGTYVPKVELRFLEFSEQTRIFLANPFYINVLKVLEKYFIFTKQSCNLNYIDLQVYSVEISQHHELFAANYSPTGSYNLIHNSQFLENKKQDSPTKQSSNQSKLSLIQKIYLGSVLVSNTLCNSIFLMQQVFTGGYILGPLMIVCGGIFLLPQYLIYMGLLITQSGITMKKKIKNISLGILKLPLLVLYGTLQFVLPTKTEEIPFLQGTKEIWATNFLPSLYVIAVKQIWMVYFFFEIKQLVINGKNRKKDMVSIEDLNNITDSNSLFLFFFYVASLALFYITFINILYIFEQMYMRYMVKHPNMSENGSISSVNQNTIAMRCSQLKFNGSNKMLQPIEENKEENQEQNQVSLQAVGADQQNVDNIDKDGFDIKQKKPPQDLEILSKEQSQCFFEISDSQEMVNQINATITERFNKNIIHEVKNKKQQQQLYRSNLSQELAQHSDVQNVKITFYQDQIMPISSCRRSSFSFLQEQNLDI